MSKFMKSLCKIAIPVTLQSMLQASFSIVDQIMIGQLGETNISAVGLCGNFSLIFSVVIGAVSTVAGILIAQFIGAEDKKEAWCSFDVSLICGIMISALFLFAAGFFPSWILGLYTKDVSIVNTGAVYFRIVAFSYIPMAVSNILSSWLRCKEHATIPFLASFGAVAVNTGLNYLLIFGKFGAPKLGVVGAAIATVIARVVECAVIIVYTHTHTGKHPFARGLYRSMKVPSGLVRQVAATGMPLLINELLWSGGMTTLNQIMSRRGLEVVSAENIASTVSNLFFCAFFAMGTSISIIIGQLLGAGKLEQAVDENRKLIAFSVALSTAVGIVMAALSPLIPNIYNTTDMVRHLATGMLLINAVMMPANAFTNSCFFTLRSGGKPLLTFLYDSVYIWVLSIPLTLFLVKVTDLPIIPIYAISYGVDIIKCIIGYIFVKKRVWVNNLVAD